MMARFADTDKKNAQSGVCDELVLAMPRVDAMSRPLRRRSPISPNREGRSCCVFAA